MSRYGQRIVRHCGIDCDYIPHGVDLEVFSPPGDREVAKEAVGAGGHFLVLSDSRNQPRKLLPRLLDVFARFAVGRPDVLLHLHTDPDDEFANSAQYSYDVRADVAQLGIEGQVRFTEGFRMGPRAGLPIEELARHYQAADIHVLVSSGEGFGLPTLQAAAAGAVPMATDYSASAELVEGHGEALPVGAWMQSQFGIRRALVDVDAAVDRLVRLYGDRRHLQERSDRSRSFALAYGWENVVDAWHRRIIALGESRRRGGRLRRTGRAPRQIVEHTLVDGGTSVTVKMQRVELGRLESTILADARAHDPEIRLPAAPRPCQVGGVKVLRRAGLVCLGPTGADETALVALQAIFPILRGWVPPADPEEARYELVQSVLVLNAGGALPQALLLDAALFGVPCVGPASTALQGVLWPDLVANDEAAARRLARRLLTDPAELLRVVEAARWRLERAGPVDESAVVASLRRLHAAHWAAPVAAGR
jgi:hypothetical protein